MEWLYLGVGLVIGSLITWLILRVRVQEQTSMLRVAMAKLEEELRSERDKAASLDILQERMKATFESLATSPRRLGNTQGTTQGPSRSA